MVQKNSLYIHCPACGAKNRLPSEKVGQPAKCGRCGHPLTTDEILSSRPITVTDATFDDKVRNSPLPVLLDCWAPWCGPCKMMGPVMEELAALWKGRIRVCKLNVDENPVTASHFQTRSIPTLLVFKNGKLMDTMVGALPKQQIIKKMEAFL